MSLDLSRCPLLVNSMISSVEVASLASALVDVPSRIVLLQRSRIYCRTSSGPLYHCLTCYSVAAVLSSQDADVLSTDVRLELRAHIRFMGTTTRVWVQWSLYSYAVPYPQIFEYLHVVTWWACYPYRLGHRTCSCGTRVHEIYLGGLCTLLQRWQPGIVAGYLL